MNLKWVKGRYKTRGGAEIEITSVNDSNGLQGYVEAEWGEKKIKLHHSWDLAGVCIDDPDLDIVELIGSGRYNKNLNE